MSELFDEVRQGLRTLQTQVSNLSNSVISRGGEQETHLPAIENEISNFWTGGDGVVYIEIDANYNPVEIEYRNNTISDVAKPAGDKTKLRKIRFKQTPYTAEHPYNIQSSTFSSCENLTTVDFGNSNVSIGYGAFSGCVGLTTLDLSSSITIGSKAFYGCTGLISVDLSNITIMGSEAFSNCSNLSTIILPNMTEIPSLAFYAAAVTELDLTGFNTIESRAFEDCPDLETVNLTNVKTINSGAFGYCPKLTNVNFNGVSTINGAAFSSSNIKSISMPDLKYIADYAFYDNLSLESISIIRNPTDVMDDRKIEFSGQPFYSCHAVKNIIIKQMQKYENGNVITIGSNFITANTSLYQPQLETIKIITHPENTVNINSTALQSVESSLTDIYVSWDENSPNNVNAPWGATSATIHYNYTE